MDLLVLIVVACLIGWLVYVLTTNIPMPAGWAQVIQVVSLVLLILYVLQRLVHLPNVL